MKRILFCLLGAAAMASIARANGPAEPHPLVNDGYCAECAGGHGIRGRVRGVHGMGGRHAGGLHHDHTEFHHRMHLMSRTGGEAEYTHNFNMYHAAQQPWHGAYYYGAYGRPVALVVPPTSAFQTEWAWGVGQTKTRPIYHQFQMGVPATVGTDGGYRFAPTPYWPSSTEQFGVYPVRGPW